MIYSIRHFLLAALLTAIGIVTALATTWGYIESLHELDEMFDAQLAQYARTLSVMIPNSATPRVINHWRAPDDSDDNEATEFGHKYESKIAFQIWNSHGRLIARSDTAPEQPIHNFQRGYHTIERDGHRWRVFVLRTDQPRHWTLTFERDDVRGELAEKIAWQAVVPVLIGAPLLTFIIWRLIGFGFRPLQQVANELSHRQANDLRALENAHLPSELAVLVQSINQLFERLAASFEREQRFAADAAHELRNPLSALLVHLENADAELDGDHHSLQQAQLAAMRMRDLLEKLLTLARTAPEHYIARFVPVNLFRLSQRIIGEYINAALHKQQQLALDGDEQLTVAGDEPALAILMGNLLKNAIQYTPPGSTITIAVTRDQAGVRWHICDNGPGIPEARHRRVFDRFYRGEGDRHRSNTEGFGLGLSIVRQIAELHGAAVHLRAGANGGGLCVDVLFTPPCDEPAHG